MGTHAINAALYGKLRFDPQKEFAPIRFTHITPRVLVVGPSVQARSVAKLEVPSTLHAALGRAMADPALRSQAAM